MYRDIPGWAGYYQVNKSGVIRSVDRIVKCSDGDRFFKGRVLKPGINPRSKYHFVRLSSPKKSKEIYIHDAVLLTFVGSKIKPLEACHNNGIKSDNRLKNLRYDTRRSNAYDRYKHGYKQKCGVERHNSSLTTKQVSWIRNLFGFLNPREMSAISGIPQSTIYHVAIRATYKNEP